MTQLAFSGFPPGHTVALVKKGRFIDLPVSKDDLLHYKSMDPEAVMQACYEFERVYGVRPSSSMIAFAYQGKMRAWNEMDGSVLRESTQQDILKRIRTGVSLTKRQKRFVNEASAWQEKAVYLSMRALVINSGHKGNFDRKELEWVPIRR
jgi:hypothetical protein